MSSSAFPARLVWWRRNRGFSQLQLALTASCSQRHLSFLELGRTGPSREMVLRLAAALDMPLRQSNELLLAAGFAPEWTESDLSAKALAPIRGALDHILAQQEPYPAVVVDRRWNLIEANAGATELVGFLVGPMPPGTPVNLADALVAPDVLRPHLVNWPEVIHYFVRGVEADAAADGTPETRELLERLLGYDGVRTALSRPAPVAEAPVLPMHFRKHGKDLRLFTTKDLRLFTTIATLGTPQDITLQELRIESFFPMDDETRETFRNWADEAGSQPAPTAVAPSSPSR